MRAVHKIHGRVRGEKNREEIEGGQTMTLTGIYALLGVGMMIDIAPWRKE